MINRLNTHCLTYSCSISYLIKSYYLIKFVKTFKIRGYSIIIKVKNLGKLYITRLLPLKFTR